MKVLITAIGHQDPFHLARVDYEKPLGTQLDILGESLATFKQGGKVLRSGPILSSLVQMHKPVRNGLSPEEADLMISWMPDELWILVERDTDPTIGLGPMMSRCRLFESNLGLPIKVRPLIMYSGIHDYGKVWSWLESHILPLFYGRIPEQEWEFGGDGSPLQTVDSYPRISLDGEDVRILIGNGTNAARMALFHLGVVLGSEPGRIWHVVDEKVARSSHAVLPLLNGPGRLPRLVPASRESELLALLDAEKQKVSELILSGRAGEVIVQTNVVKRVAAQRKLEELLDDPSAPIWKGDRLSMDLLREALASALTTQDQPIKASSLKRWFTEGRKPPSDRDELFLTMPADPRRPPG